MNVTATSASCITNIDLCTSGFTFAVDISFALLLDNTYIVSSGGNLPGDVGVALYYSQNNLYYIVSSSTFTWTLVVTYTPALNVWQHFEITWNPHLGVEILVNGRSLGTHGRPNPSGGSITLPLSIACSQTQVTVNVNMMVTGMTWWNFDRTMLVNAGIIPGSNAVSTTANPATITTTTTTTTTATTTTPQPPTTTPKPYEQYNMTFLSVTGNVLITPTFNFTLHNKPTLELNNNSHTTLHLNCAQQQYVELPNTGIPCMQDLATCQKGFTFKLELEFTALNASQKAYILSSGGDSAASSGMAIYLQNNMLIIGVKEGLKHWVGRYNMTGNLKLNVWYKFEISWDGTKGISVLIDGYQVINDSHWTPSPGVTQTNAVLIGKTAGEDATSCMNIRDLFTWTIHREVLVTIGVLPASLTSTTTSTTTATTTTQPSVTPRMHSTTTPIASKITQQLTAATTTQTPPPTTTTTPTSTAQIPSYGWSLWNINNTVVVGVDYNLTVHGTRPIDNVGVHLNTSGSYIIINALSDSCLPNPAACTTIGLTLQITMQFHKIEEHTYILTSGGQTPDGVGIAILYRYGKFQFVLTTFNMSWYASVGRDAFPADWLHDVVVSWSDDTGIEIFVNNVLFDYNRTPLPHRPTSPAYANAIFIGKQPSTSAGVNVDFTLREFKFWNARIEVLVDKGIFRPPVRPMLVGCRV